MIHRSARLVSLQRSSGFTLVELLVTIVIIAILASMVLGALFTSQEAAKEARTKGLIAKLNTVVMDRWESYRTRRLPIRMGYNRFGVAFNETPLQFALRQLYARRELMRIEMPDNFTDINASLSLSYLPNRSALSQAYFRKYVSVASPNPQYESAECLYLILLLNRDEASTELIAKNAGDRDGDGLPEILDGWGNPIGFLRRAPGFVSELQPNQDAVNNHDPFDPRRVDPAAWAMYPLIYSYGPDQEPELETGGPMPGSWVDGNGDGQRNDIDNIHNHLIGIR
jgi:prepilin-type N-terminal cleavage/methylation domain-containing protein